MHWSALIAGSTAPARSSRHTWNLTRSTAISALPVTLSRMTATSSAGARSEEHTSELQSLMRISYAVFCLKKKTTQNTSRITTNQPKAPKDARQSHNYRTHIHRTERNATRHSDSAKHKTTQR